MSKIQKRDMCQIKSFELRFKNRRIVTAEGLVKSKGPIFFKFLDGVWRFFGSEESKAHNDSPHHSESLFEVSISFLSDLFAYF